MNWEEGEEFGFLPGLDVWSSQTPSTQWEEAFRAVSQRGEGCGRAGSRASCSGAQVLGHGLPALAPEHELRLGQMREERRDASG